MLPRFRSSIILAFLFLTVFLLLARNNAARQYGSQSLSKLRGTSAAQEIVGLVSGSTGTEQQKIDGQDSTKGTRPEAVDVQAEKPDGSSAEWKTTSTLKPQEQFVEEFEYLGK
jgi:hypothetical protein